MATTNFNQNLFRLVVEEIAGKEGVDVSTVLVNTEETTDEEIATKTELKLHTIDFSPIISYPSIDGVVEADIFFNLVSKTFPKGSVDICTYIFKLLTAII